VRARVRVCVCVRECVCVCVRAHLAPPFIMHAYIMLRILIALPVSDVFFMFPSLRR
jgi:hypothetical protein